MNELNVLGLKIKDLRNIELVEVDLKGQTFVEVNGDNGAAKSTLLDALFGAMIGGKYFGGSKHAWEVVRAGQKKALIKVTLGNDERQIEIKRSITRKENDSGEVSAGGSLSITDTDDKNLDQKFLDSLISTFTVDVRDFARRDTKEQVAILFDLIGINLGEIESKIDDVKTARRDFGRDLKRHKTLAAELRCEKVEEVSLEALVEQRQEIEKFNADQLLLTNAIAEKNRDVTAIDDFVALKAERITELKDELETIETRVKVKEKRKEDLLAEITGMAQPQENQQTLVVDNQITEVERTNTLARQYAQYVKEQTKTDELEASVEKCNKRIVKINTATEEKVKAAKLPFKNLVLDPEKGLVIGGLAFSQKSSAEQIRISAQIGMKLNPDFKVLCIRDGSLLDEPSYKVLKELSEKNGYQVLVESVGERQGDNAIVLRAGQMISAFEKPKTVEEKANDLEDTL